VSAEHASSRTALGHVVAVRLPLADHLRNGELMRERKVELCCDCTFKGRDVLAFPGPKLPSKEEVTLTYESATRVLNLWFSRSLHADFLLDCQTVFLLCTLKEKREPLWSIDGEAWYLQGITEDHGKIFQKKSITLKHTSIRNECEGRT
jgi:hypothetical protein